MEILPTSTAAAAVLNLPSAPANIIPNFSKAEDVLEVENDQVIEPVEDEENEESEDDEEDEDDDDDDEEEVRLVFLFFCANMPKILHFCTIFVFFFKSSNKTQNV